MTASAPTPSGVELSGLLVQPIAQRLADWTGSGKLDEDALDTLSTEARAWVDHSIAPTDWARVDDVEALVDLAATQLGGETGLVEWADEIAADLLGAAGVSEVVAAANRLADDGPGFAASQTAERLLRAVRWQYEGGASRFTVRFDGLCGASPALKSLLGACFARIADAGDRRAFDTRFEGVDDGALSVFGELEAEVLSEGEASRLHRAALIP